MTRTLSSSLNWTLNLSISDLVSACFCINDARQTRTYIALVDSPRLVCWHWNLGTDRCIRLGDIKIHARYINRVYKAGDKQKCRTCTKPLRERDRPNFPLIRISTSRISDSVSLFITREKSFARYLFARPRLRTRRRLVGRAPAVRNKSAPIRKRTLRNSRWFGAYRLLANLFADSISAAARVLSLRETAGRTETTREKRETSHSQVSDSPTCLSDVVRDYYARI